MARRRGHRQSAATRAKISASLKGRHRGGASTSTAASAGRHRSHSTMVTSKAQAKSMGLLQKRSIYSKRGSARVGEMARQHTGSPRVIGPGGERIRKALYGKAQRGSVITRRRMVRGRRKAAAEQIELSRWM